MLRYKPFNFIVYRRTSSVPYSGAPQDQVVQAVAQFVSSLCRPEDEQTELVPQCLDASAPLRELLEKGIGSYLLPGQKGSELLDIPALPSVFEKYVSPEILKARKKHRMCISAASLHSFYLT